MFADPSPPYTYVAEPTSDHPHPLVGEWQGHVDAGWIGAGAGLDPALLANLRKTEALFRGLRRGR